MKPDGRVAKKEEKGFFMVGRTNARNPPKHGVPYA